MAAPHVHVFLSTVTAEFRAYRDALRHGLDRPNLTVKVQEDFIATGTETLDLLDQYIQQCQVVVHLVGDMTGAMARPLSVALIRERYPDFGRRFPALAPYLAPDGSALPYTQWEAWLALWHGKRLLIAVPEVGVVRDAGYVADPGQQALQLAHLARLKMAERHPGIRFTSPDRLAAEVWRSGLLDVLIEAGLVRRAHKLPYRTLGALFKGRDAWLEALTQRFGPVPRREGEQATALALTGLGGAGKTRLALEYAWRRDGEYPSLLFVSASSPAVLHGNLAALCGPAVLDLPEQHATEQDRQLAAVLAWLRRQPGWLLILDNVDSPESAGAVEALLPQLAGGHVLITGRMSNWSGAVQALPPVEVLPPDAAAEFLLLRTQGKRRTQPDDEAVAATLAAEMGGLALALEQAGAYVARRQSSLSQYLAQWAQRRDEVLAWFDPRLMQYPASVAITWQASFDQLSPGARRLLQRLAWLAPEPIPESLLDVPVPGREEDEGDPWDALAELAGYSLVRRDEELPVFSVHRLVQEVTRRGQAVSKPSIFTMVSLWLTRSISKLPALHRLDIPVSAGNALQEALTWIDRGFVGQPMDVRTWPVLDPLAAHALAVARHADSASMAVGASCLLNKIGLLFLAKARYADAEPLMHHALTIVEINLGRDHSEVATCLNNLTQLLQDTSRFAEAEPLIRRALTIDQANFGQAHPRVANDLNNLAQLLQDTNRLAEAEPLMRHALDIYEAWFGQENPEVASLYSNLARLLQDTNRLAEAEPLIRRALAIDEFCFGNKHPNVARDLISLASLLQDTNRLTEAEALMRRALAIDEASLGDEHPEVAIDLNNLARLLQNTNRYAEAEPLIRRAIAIDEASFGKENPVVVRKLNNLAALLWATNRLAEAEPLIRRALVIIENQFGKEHPDLAICFGHLAMVLHATNRLTEAEPLMRSALAIDQASFGKEHPRVAVHLNNLAQLLQTTNRYAEAEPLMRRALSIDKASFGNEHPMVAIRLNNLAQLLKATNRLAEAEPLMQQALAVFISGLGSKHPHSNATKDNYTALLRELGRTEEEIAATLADLGAGE